MIEKKIPLADLDKRQRVQVLEAMIAGVNSAFFKRLDQQIHSHFLACLQTGKAFDPDSVWAALPVSTQNHFAHARATLDDLESRLRADRTFPNPRPDTDTEPTPKEVKRPPKRRAGKKR